MKLMQEFLKIHEGAKMDPMMDRICQSCQAAKTKGLSYEKAVKAIAAEFRKLDKHDSSKMSDEALDDMIMAFYNHDKHLSANDNVTSYRDVNFNYKVHTEGQELGEGKYSGWKPKRLPKVGEYVLLHKDLIDEPKHVKAKVTKVSGAEVYTVDDTGGKRAYLHGQDPVKIIEDAFGDQQGGPGSLDNQRQGAMPASEDNEGKHVDSVVNQGPEGGEAKTPEPNETPPATRTIAKAGKFQVVLGKNEQISILDGTGNIRLSMPYVIWKELVRQ